MSRAGSSSKEDPVGAAAKLTIDPFNFYGTKSVDSNVLVSSVPLPSPTIVVSNLQSVPPPPVPLTGAYYGQPGVQVKSYYSYRRK
jgi:hypothetical protein